MNKIDFTQDPKTGAVLLAALPLSTGRLHVTTTDAKTSSLARGVEVRARVTVTDAHGQSGIVEERFRTEQAVASTSAPRKHARAARGRASEVRPASQ